MVVAMVEKCTQTPLVLYLINEYRTRKAIRGYVEGGISLGKAAEVAGMSKKKFMAMIENLGIPFNISAYDLVKGSGFLSELRGNSAGGK
jgi:predicted HTH domain antitoxin